MESPQTNALIGLPHHTWALIFSTVVNPSNGGLRKFSALMSFATASKAYRELVVSFIIGRLGVPSEIEAIVSDPSHVLDTYGSLPILGVPHQGSRTEYHKWSLRRSTSFSTGFSDLPSLPPHASAVTIVFNATNVSFGQELVLTAGIRCLIIVRRNTTAIREKPAPVSGYITGPGVTHLVVSPTARELASIACLRTPNVKYLLIGCALGSLSGLELLPCIESLAINDAVPCHIGNIGSLVNLRKLYIGLSRRDAFLKFTSDVLPALTGLVSLSLCTPRGAADHSGAGAHLTCLTGLTSLSLNGISGFDELEHVLGGKWPLIYPSRPSYTMLPPAITDLAVYGTWFSLREKASDPTQITSLRLDSIETVHTPPFDPQPLTALALLGLNPLSAAALTSLTITRCSDLKSLAGIGTMRFLTELSVTECARLEEPDCLDDLYQLTALQTLDLDIILVMYRVPPTRLHLKPSLRRLR